MEKSNVALLRVRVERDFYEIFGCDWEFDEWSWKSRNIPLQFQESSVVDRDRGNWTERDFSSSQSPPSQWPGKPGFSGSENNRVSSLSSIALPLEGHHASNTSSDTQITWRPANLRPRKAGSRFEPTHLLGGNGMRGARLGDSCWWKVQSCRWQCWSRDPCLGQTWWWWRLATFIIAGSQQFSRLQVESGNHL